MKNSRGNDSFEQWFQIYRLSANVHWLILHIWNFTRRKWTIKQIKMISGLLQHPKRIANICIYTELRWQNLKINNFTWPFYSILIHLNSHKFEFCVFVEFYCSPSKQIFNDKILHIDIYHLVFVHSKLFSWNEILYFVNVV